MAEARIEGKGHPHSQSPSVLKAIVEVFGVFRSSKAQELLNVS